MSLKNQDVAAAASVKEDIEFRADNGVILRGWVITPDSEGPHPAIVMTPGFSSSITRLETVADAFVARGFGVLLYDQQTCGSSDGEPRQDIDPVAQERDLQMALSFVEQHPALDSDRIGLWGSSYSGAMVLVVAAMDRRVKAVVSQVPFISGYDQFVLGNGEGALAAINDNMDQDRQEGSRVRSPAVSSWSGCRPIRLTTRSSSRTRRTTSTSWVVPKAPPRDGSTA